MAEKRDYYEVLGVSKTATDAEIKKAFRQQAKKYHPDIHPGDKECEEKFKEAQEAYAVLSDPDKRRQYDQFGHAAFDGTGGGAGGFDFSGMDMGDIFQIVLSNRLSAPFEGSLFDTYRVLRTINPSPYMFYFSGTDVEVAGASPETLVKLENGVLHTFPLAGTRPRGATAEEDKKLEEGLLKDEKELAEHNMLVDLGRNDLGKVSKFGTVKVEKLHSIERYSHVMHIGSTVRGEIREEYDALDAIEAVLPAGTLSGAPKT